MFGEEEGIEIERNLMRFRIEFSSAQFDPFYSQNQAWAPRFSSLPCQINEDWGARKLPGVGRTDLPEFYPKTSPKFTRADDPASWPRSRFSGPRSLPSRSRPRSRFDHHPSRSSKHLAAIAAYWRRSRFCPFSTHLTFFLTYLNL